MEIKDLTERALDYAVAKAVGYGVHIVDAVIGGREISVIWISRPEDKPEHWINLIDFRPSVDWKYGGPIFDQHISSIGADDRTGLRYAWHNEGGMAVWGPTLLVAAMRAVVADAFPGGVVEIADGTK